METKQKLTFKGGWDTLPRGKVSPLPIFVLGLGIISSYKTERVGIMSPSLKLRDSWKSVSGKIQKLTSKWGGTLYSGIKCPPFNLFKAEE
jgi:hypothetical protein